MSKIAPTPWDDDAARFERAVERAFVDDLDDLSPYLGDAVRVVAAGHYAGAA